MTIDPIHILEQLVRINSVNAFYPGGPGEGGLADFVESFWNTHGIENRRQNVLPGRDNVIAELPGMDTKRRLLLEAHMDTVSVAGMTIPPFDPKISQGKLYGRGSCDTKAGLACMMAAVANAKQQGVIPKSSILVASVIDEEFSCLGVKKLCETLEATAAIVAEPTELKTVVASKGVLRWRIIAKGKQAHSSKVHLGINAIEHMGHLLVALQDYHRSLAEIQHPLLGCATGNVGLIEGGVQVNFVPDRCAIQIDRRLLPPLLYDAGLETPADAQIARLSCRVLDEMGYSDQVEGVAYGSDGTQIRALGIETIIFGPGSIDQAHTECEFVDIQQVRAAFEYYQRMLQEF
jgi:acetylornithine deacetylase